MARQLSFSFEVRVKPRPTDPYAVTRSLDRQAQDLSRREGIPLTDALFIVWKRTGPEKETSGSPLLSKEKS